MTMLVSQEAVMIRDAVLVPQTTREEGGDEGLGEAVVQREDAGGVAQREDAEEVAQGDVDAEKPLLNFFSPTSI